MYNLCCACCRGGGKSCALANEYLQYIYFQGLISSKIYKKKSAVNILFNVGVAVYLSKMFYCVQFVHCRDMLHEKGGSQHRTFGRLPVCGIRHKRHTHSSNNLSGTLFLVSLKMLTRIRLSNHFNSRLVVICLIKVVCITISDSVPACNFVAFTFERSKRLQTMLKMIIIQTIRVYTSP